MALDTPSMALEIKIQGTSGEMRINKLFFRFSVLRRDKLFSFQLTSNSRGALVSPLPSAHHKKLNPAEKY